MKLVDLKKLCDDSNIRLGSSEELELINGENEFYHYLRNIGYYRVFETYYKDPMYQTFEFYCTGFINSETGYNFLLSVSEDYFDLDFDNMKADLYIVIKGNSKYLRKDKRLFTGTFKEILEYSKNLDKENLDYAIRHSA